MPDTWIKALNAFAYRVNLRDYGKRSRLPGFFEMEISGDRDSTIKFEKHYSETAPNHLAAFYEVVFWKLYSQGGRSQIGTDRVVEFTESNGVTADQLWTAVVNFVKHQSLANLKNIRDLMGYDTNVLAVPLTLPALAHPQTMRMIDKQVAKWINRNVEVHNRHRTNRMTPFRMNYTSLRQNDFQNYLNWIEWCREVADVLRKHTGHVWRARDVEMAVFTAQRTNRDLHILLEE